MSCAVDRRVDRRKLLQRVHRRLDEEAHEAELDAVLLLEALLVAVAQIDHRLHVDFVERGQDRGGRLRLHEALGDALAQPRHRHALLGPLRFRDASRRRRHGARRGRGGAAARRRCGRAAARRCGLRLRRLRRRDHVALGDPPAAPGAVDARPDRRRGRPSSCARRAAPRRRRRSRRGGRRRRAPAAGARRGCAAQAPSSRRRQAPSRRPWPRCR